MTGSDERNGVAPLISASNLLGIIDDHDVGVVDCRFALDDTEKGRREWSTTTLPGARYAHLDIDLSGARGTGERGRHPLPDPDHVAMLRSNWGFDEETLIVCFDDSGGPFAARLWWMLHWIGHSAVTVLDGGWKAWLDVGGTTQPGVPIEMARNRIEHSSLPEASPNPEMLATSEDLMNGDLHLVDARARERYLGVAEPIDPVAGHIPGALNMPWMENLGPDGRFLPPAELALQWKDVPDAGRAVCYCGSGVTACHNILAAAAAGLARPRLFAPSWSGWIHDPSRPVETGPE